MSGSEEAAYDSLYQHFHVVKDKPLPVGNDFRRYRDAWRRTAVDHVVTPFPLHLDIEVTSYCNLRCPMCPRTHRVRLGQWENKHMSFDLYKSIISEGAASGLCAVNLNNFGEPLLHRDLCRMVRYAKDRGVLDVMLHTSGTILSEDLSAELISAGLDTIIFSVDSITKYLYEKIRVNGTFETTIANIRRFSAIRRQLRREKPHIRISMVRMKVNAHEAELLAEFWGEDADSITYVDYRNQDSLDAEDRYVARRPRNLSYACPSLWQRMTVNVTGEVTACCRDAGKRLTIGKLEPGVSLRDIWDSDELRRARVLHETGNAWKLEACNGCDHIRGYQLAQQPTV